MSQPVLFIGGSDAAVGIATEIGKRHQKLRNGTPDVARVLAKTNNALECC
jgi:hypothetical protein